MTAAKKVANVKRIVEKQGISPKRAAAAIKAVSKKKIKFL